MPIVRWIARLYRATFWLLLHVAIAAGLFLVSAAFGASPDQEQRNGLYFFRIPAAFWLFIAVWHFVVRGVLARPAPVPSKGKPTGAEAARSALGCLAWLVPVAATYVYVGRIADWAWAGFSGTDPAHPARRVLDGALALGSQAVERPETSMPYIVGTLVVLGVANALAGIALASASGGRKDAGSARERARAAGRGRSRARQSGGPGVGPERVAAGAASADAVNTAHAGAHRLDDRFQRPAPRPAPGAPEDPVLGVLTWSAADGAWWARRDDRFPLRIDGSAEGPSGRQIEIARSVVQRTFEVLLRGSDAARAAALARGVGLPRFLIAAAVVGPDAGAATPLTLHLRCEGDTSTDYVVRSTDGLLTFAKV